MSDKTTRPRVVIAEDHSGIVTQVVALLGSEFEVVAIAQEGVSAIDCIRQLDPDIALIDLYMPGMNGLDVVRTLKASATRTITVIMSAYQAPELAEAAVAAGAMAFVTKSRLAQDLVFALHTALQGSVFLSTSDPFGSADSFVEGVTFRRL